MRSFPLLLSVSLLLTALAVAPAAEAADRCTFLSDWCPGLVCKHDGHRWHCIHEPDPRDLLCNETWCLERLVLP